ncbi:MAG: hypothetical protein KF832_27035 [Caldilineaceae bacterium]|nr:hypothetical protein [Caldilineaceae bacterium]
MQKLHSFFQWLRRWRPSTMQPPRLTLLLLIFVIGGVVAFGFYRSTRAQPGVNCSASFFVDQTLQNGARWQLCWEHRSLDGIVLRDMYYTPPGGVARRVLAQGSIAQVHVPYDDNSARFHDITDDGFGDDNLNNLTAVECPGGVLLKYGDKNAICQQIQPRGYAFAGLGMQEQGEYLSLFSVSISGEYNYIPVWRFGDDGSLELLMGAAGKLQRYTSDNRFGWPVRANGIRGTSHIHNYYWRLDFDLGERGDDDIVEEFNYAPSADNTQRALGVTRLTSEAGRSINPVGLRSWRIRDGAATNAQGQAISYQLEPTEIGHRDVGPSYEPWTTNDFYVTKHRECERYASHNPQLNGCANHLAAFVNGESIEGADVVLWYGATFHHIARDEDEPFMHTHWSGFRLTPRDWLDANPAAADLVTCAVGDVSCDGQVDAADALFMLQHDVQRRTAADQLPLPAGTLYRYACDVSGEGQCNAMDALFTLQCSVGLPNLFCATAAGLHAAQSSATATPLLLVVGEPTQDEHAAIRIPIQATGDGVGAVSAVLTYPATWSGSVTCVAQPAAGFDLAACNVDQANGIVRLSLVATAGSRGEVTAGEVRFAPSLPAATTIPWLVVQKVTAMDTAGNWLPVQTIHPDQAKPLYLPLIQQ